MITPTASNGLHALRHAGITVTFAGTEFIVGKAVRVTDDGVPGIVES